MDNFDLLRKIAEQTIGFDIEPVKSMSEEETKEQTKENDFSNIWDENDFFEKCSRKRDAFEETDVDETGYVPTDEEISVISSIIHYDNIDYLKKWSFNKVDDNTIIVSTPRSSWLCLAGREWVVDMKERTSRLTKMS